MAVSIPSAMPNPRDVNELYPDFDDWALRNGYVRDHFSGEVQIPASAEHTLIDLTVPAGETWYRRTMWYAVSGGRVAEFKVYRTMPGKAGKYFNRVVLHPLYQPTEQINTAGKYPAGSRFWVSVKPDMLARATDLVTTRLLYVALPWEE